MNVNDLLLILPLVILVLWACVLLLVDLFIPRTRKGITALLAGLGMLVAMGFAITDFQLSGVVFSGMMVVDGFSHFLDILLLASGLVGVALAYDYIRRMNIERGEYYILLMFSISGMMLMASAADLIVVFLALELLSIPLYVLSSFAAPRPESEEAGIKYFLLGAFSSGFMVYGIAMIFGAAGSTQLAGIVSAITGATANMTLLTVGAGLFMIGLAFKVAVVPFHMWTPDVYQGAPSSVVAFMSVGAKVAGFAALLRVFVLAFPALSNSMVPILWAISAITMIIGNFVAIAQTNIKRLLAYSSISHAGYIFMAMVPYWQPKVANDAVAAALFYLLAYAFTNLGAWAVVIALEQAEGRGLEIKDFAGLASKYPALAAAMAIFMLSFTGVPPTLGFLGKFYLFRAVLEGGYVSLAIIGVLTSLISAYYYLRVVIVMYMQEGAPVARREPWLYLTTLVTAVGTVVFTLYSAPFLAWASQAILQVF